MVEVCIAARLLKGATVKKKGAKKGHFSQKKRAKKRGKLRAAFSDEQLIFLSFFQSNAGNINYIEGTSPGFFALIWKN